MKILASFLFAATLAVAAAPAVTAQDITTGERVEGRLSRPSPSPGANQQTAESAGKVEAMLATDEKGKNTATTFASSTPVIYLVTKNISGAKGDKVRAQWVAEDTGKALPKNKTLTDNAMALPDTKSYNPSFNQPAPLKGAFPPGKYHVTLSVGSKEIKSLKFTVK